MSLLLVGCGVLLAGAGTWFGYDRARDAIAPAVHRGDPTREAIDSARPIHERPAVRHFARSVAAAVGWLVVAMYGLFLASTGLALGGLQ